MCLRVRPHISCSVCAHVTACNVCMLTFFYWPSELYPPPFNARRHTQAHILLLTRACHHINHVRATDSEAETTTFSTWGSARSLNANMRVLQQCSWNQTQQLKAAHWESSHWFKSHVLSCLIVIYAKQVSQYFCSLLIWSRTERSVATSYIYKTMPIHLLFYGWAGKRRATFFLVCFYGKWVSWTAGLWKKSGT